MSNTEGEKPQPSRGRKHICVPFESEAQYHACIEDVMQYRTYLTQMSGQHPEVFPQAMARGYTLSLEKNGGGSRSRITLSSYHA